MRASYKTYASILETYAPGQILNALHDAYGTADPSKPKPTVTTGFARPAQHVVDEYAKELQRYWMAERQKAAAEAQKNNQPRQCPSWEVYGKADTSEQRTPGILYRWTWT